MSGLAGANVLVTGGAGMIGSTVVDQLLRGGAASVVVLDNLVRGRLANLDDALTSGRVTFVEGDLRDPDLVERLTRGTDLVFHEAAVRMAQCAENPRFALQVLVDGTFNVLEAAVRQRVDRVVFASSDSVYGMADEFPTPEQHHHQHADTFYGTAKSFDEGMLRSFHAMYGLPYVALRYFNVYGPRMDVHGLYTEVLVQWMERIAEGRGPLVFGDGTQTMDFVHVRDVARANLLAATSPVQAGVYNVASGRETSLLKLAERLLAAMDSDLEIEHGPEREMIEVMRRLGDTQAARRDLGFEAEVGLDEGLRELVEWWHPLRVEIAASRTVSL